MSNNQDENFETNGDTDDLEEYLKETEQLRQDFSDLEDLDLEEIQEMKDAILKVKEFETLEEHVEIEVDENYVESSVDDKEAMMTDFSDLGKVDLDELLEMKQAVEEVKEEEVITSGERPSKSETSVSDELAKRIGEELQKKKEKEEKKVVTEDQFLEYIKQRKDKIWYHALYYLVFEVEDHIASKNLLYNVLKEDTSKSPIDPIPEHQFYFGLGYILRLTINNQQIVRYMTGGKFKININPELLKKLLNKAGEPIITRPTIAEEKKKKMFKEFFKEDFENI